MEDRVAVAGQRSRTGSDLVPSQTDDRRDLVWDEQKVLSITQRRAQTDPPARSPEPASDCDHVQLGLPPVHQLAKEETYPRRRRRAALYRRLLHARLALPEWERAGNDAASGGGDRRRPRPRRRAGAASTWARRRSATRGSRSGSRALGRVCVDWGDVEVGVPEATEIGDPRARYLDSIKASCGRVAALVAKARADGFVPLVLGGDHSIAIGTLGGMAKARGAGGVLWIDAHGDLNRPETSPTGNVHGMPLAAALGAAGPGVRERRVADAVGRARRARRRPVARRGRARADRRARRARLHDERDRPARRRARPARGARVPRRRGVPARQPRPRRRRPDVRARRRHARCAAASPTARRTWRSSSSPSRACSTRSTSSR